MNIENKKVFLNGKDITNDVSKVSNEDIVDQTNKLLGDIFRSEATITYNNGGKYILGDRDILDIKSIERKPKFKIGDYVVEDANRNELGNVIQYIKIHTIVYEKTEDKFFYNIVYNCEGNGEFTASDECDLRRPNKEELNIYFR